MPKAQVAPPPNRAKVNAGIAPREATRTFVRSADAGYLAALLLASSLQSLPARLRVNTLDKLSRLVGGLWACTNGTTPQRVRHYLETLFDISPSDPALKSAVRQHLTLTVWNALILNLLPTLKAADVCRLITFDGLDQLSSAAAAARPILLLGGHYGAYGYAVAAALSAQGYATSLIGYQGSDIPPPDASQAYLRWYWPRVQRLNERVNLVAVKPGQREQPALAAILKQRRSIFYLLADQYFPPATRALHLVPVHLLQRNALWDITAVQLARKHDATPFIAIPQPDGSGRHITLEPLAWRSANTAPSAIREELQEYASRLEARLRACPALWRDLRRVDLLQRLPPAAELEE